MIQNRNKNHLLCAIVFEPMVYHDPKFLISKTKKLTHFFLRLEDVFILLYHTRQLQQIHWNENFYRMYGLAVIASVARLNICQILMRSAFKTNLLKPILFIINPFFLSPKMITYILKKSYLIFGNLLITNRTSKSSLEHFLKDLIILDDKN